MKELDNVYWPWKNFLLRKQIGVDYFTKYEGGFHPTHYDEVVTFVGGAIASIWQGEEPKDYDIILNWTDTNKYDNEDFINYFLVDYFRLHFPKSLTFKRYSQKPLSLKEVVQLLVQGELNFFGNMSENTYGDIPDPYRIIYVTKNAVTLKNGFQILLRYPGDPDEVIKQFDFLHTQAHWCRDGGLTTSTKALEAMRDKQLIYTSQNTPARSLRRMIKFIRRGYSISNFELNKIVQAVMKMEPEKVEEALYSLNDYLYDPDNRD